MFERLCEWKIWMRNTQINRWVPRLAFQANNPQGEQSESTHDIQTSGQTKLKEFWHDPLISNKLVSMTEVIEFYNTVLRWCCTYMRCSRTGYSGNTTLFFLPNRRSIWLPLSSASTNYAVWRFRLVQGPSFCPAVWLGTSWIIGLNGWMFLDLVIWYLIEYKILIK